MTLRVVPEGLAAASARIEALTARLASAQAGSAPLITAVVPAAADPVSLQTAAGFSLRGGQHAAVAAQGTDGAWSFRCRGRRVGRHYAAADAAAAGSYHGVWG